MGSLPASELNGHLAHAARRPLDKDVLARLQISVVEDALPRGRHADRDRSRLLEAQALRFER